MALATKNFFLNALHVIHKNEAVTHKKTLFSYHRSVCAYINTNGRFNGRRVTKSEMVKSIIQNYNNFLISTNRKEHGMSLKK